jgi:hypothetical protein
MAVSIGVGDGERLPNLSRHAGYRVYSDAVRPGRNASVVGVIR